MIRQCLALTLAAAVVASSACFNFTSTVTSPSGTATGSSLAGAWSSLPSSPSATSCTDFHWAVTQTSGNTASGTFSAICFGNAPVNGSASGSLANSVLTWTAAATATVPGFTTCSVSLSGTATLQGDTIVVPYSGTSCLGPLSGTQTLKK
jgi:hypothetical protein